MRDLKEMFYMGIVAFVIVLIIFGVLLTFEIWAKKIACEQKSISFEDSRYGIFSGCMVLHNEKWLPLESIHQFNSEDL